MPYVLTWNKEEIDEFDTEKEARAMAVEYALAYRGAVTVHYRKG